MNRPRQDGIALIAALLAMTLLLLLALPFSVSMSRGADVAMHGIEARQVELLSDSVRELLLADAALGHPTYDPTPECDDRSEYPAAVPDVYPQLGLGGRARLGGEVVDLQRFVALDAVTPLLLCNLLGSTARLAADLEPDATSLRLDDASGLPEAGLVWCDHEVIRYGQKNGNTLLDLERGALGDLGFVPPTEHVVAATALVLDFRCVLAAAWPFFGRTGGSRDRRLPLAEVDELTELASAGCGAFSLHELDVLRAVLRGRVHAETAPTWGRPERVFEDLRSGMQPPQRTLVVKSALHLGGGSTVRVRNLRTGAVEYNLVMSTRTPRGQRELLLPSEFHLGLLFPFAQDFPAMDTVVEPLVPAPVNANTADARVLAALFAGLRRGMDVRVHAADGQQRVRPQPPITRGEAEALAAEIVGHREQQGPVPGFREFAGQFFAARFDAASGQEQKLRWLDLYRSLLTGRDSAIEMNTAPIAFRSGPLVGYRAAAAVQRGAAATGIAARHERTGVAVALPGLPLQEPWSTQEQLEEAFRLDQRAPYYITGPVNTSAVGAGEPGNDPSSRYFAHVVPMAFPQFGFGQPRFPARGGADAHFQPAPAVAVPSRWFREARGHEAFAAAIDPRGHDLRRDGPFAVRNTGPRDRGASQQPVEPAPSGGHQLTHGFTVAGGVAGRFAIGAWFEPEALGAGTLFDYGTGDRERNRMSLQVRDGALLYEVLDEAGLDPDPSQSPAGVRRTAATWRLPLSELALPPRTPVHVVATAYGSRPSDLSVAVDGMTRGRVLHRTFLTAPVPPFDPQLTPAGPPGSSTRDPRYLLLQVEDTDGFPPQGIVRVGTELFEYTEIRGNAFACVFRDSTGGRGARQIPREHRPSIPVDQNGRPTVSVDDLAQQGVNLDVFPEHPVGAEVELYGYSTLISRNVVLNVRATTLDGDLGAFAVARGFVRNGVTIAIQANQITIPIGTGLDETFTGDIDLKEPPRAGQPLNRDPARENDAPAEILAAFPPNGGFALLVQLREGFEPPLGAVASSTEVGGIEVIRYARRQGSRLTGITRAAALPGDNSQIRREFFDGTARRFVTDWNLTVQPPGQPRPISYDEIPQRILWLVPISIALQNAADLADPAATGTSEWLQLLPRGDTTDTEWVRYDAKVDQRHVVRGNRARWLAMYFALTRQMGVPRTQVGPLGNTNDPINWMLDAAQIWGTVTPTSGYIGYIPQLESSYPEILAVRQALAFRGDPFTGTSSHPQPGSSVLPCHRMQLRWGNFGALTGRPGRHDRVALVQGSRASGTSRPAVEWHTVNWSARRYTGDNQAQARGGQPTELLGAEPFQLVAFRDGVRNAFLGAAAEEVVDDVRLLDRLVKFPSGELPAAACEQVMVGGAADGGEVMRGLVDEIDVTDHMPFDLIVDQAFDASARQFLVTLGGAAVPQGTRFYAGDLSQSFPPGGGLVQVDGEILAYASRQNGTFEIARNGRGLLNTVARGHDRGARVRFLTHRPAAILLAGVQPGSNVLPVQALGAMPGRYGTALLGQELLHYTWVRRSGDQVSFEMPLHFLDEDRDEARGRGLFRGRYGTAPQGAAAGEVLIAFPFRYWDRFVERSDDPELGFFQLTTHQAPVYFRTLRWRAQTTDATVESVLLVRADERAAWTAEPDGRLLRRLQRSAGQDEALRLGIHATQLELRFGVLYRPGAVDLAAFTAHGWKTAPRIDEVTVEYEGEGRVLAEKVTTR